MPDDVIMMDLYNENLMCKETLKSAIKSNQNSFETTIIGETRHEDEHQEAQSLLEVTASHQCVV